MTFWHSATGRSSARRTLGSRVCLLASVWLALGAAGRAQANAGIIRGKVTDPSGGVIQGATVRLSNPFNEYMQAAVTDAEGTYRLIDVPFNSYTLAVEAAWFEPFTRRIVVRSNLVAQLDVQLQVASVRQQVSVLAGGQWIDAQKTAPSVVIDSNRILAFPAAQPSRSTEEIIATAPGWTLDANGRLHVRGIEYQVQYSIDGIPISDTLAATFASSPDPRNFRSVEVTTANIPAEYGNKLAGVVAVNSRTGLEIPASGSVTLSGGSFSSYESSFDVGGRAHKFGYFLSAAGGASSRFLDPPALENFHNHGRAVKTFARLDFAPSTKDLLRLTVFVNGQGFDVPNLPEQQTAGQSQLRETHDNMEALAWQHNFSGNLQSYLAFFQRYNSARLQSNLLATPVFAEQSRHNASFGGLGSLTAQVNNHTLKAGFELVRFPVTESFAFAITNLAALLEKEPDLPGQAQGFTLANPFSFRAEQTGWEGSAYVQDHFRAAHDLTLDLGLRLDSYHFLVPENFVSPRLGAAYYLSKTRTVLRGSVNRFMETPALENLLLSSSRAARVFSPAGETSGGTPVTGEPVRLSREWQIDVGFEQQVWRSLRLDVDFYHRWLQNPPEITNFLETGVIFPATLARSRSKGVETRLDLAPVRGLSGFVSYTNLHIFGSAPITGGLFLGEAVDSIRRAGQRVKIEEDQRNTVVFEARYDLLPRGCWVAFGGRHDSGYTVELDSDVTRQDFVDEFPAAILDLVNFDRGFVRPHTVLHFSAGKNFKLDEHLSLAAQFNIQNLTDTFYLITFESVFSGTTLGRPRTYSGRLTFQFK
jgi:hypothetical protein